MKRYRQIRNEEGRRDQQERRQEAPGEEAQGCEGVHRQDREAGGGSQYGFEH